MRRNPARKNNIRHTGRAALQDLRRSPFLLPSLIGVALLTLLPFADVIARSLRSAMGGNFVGASNYAAVLSNEAFRLAAFNTARFLLVCIPLLMVLALICALMLYALGNKAPFFKTTFLLPMAVPVASIVLVWRVVFAPSGLANAAIEALGGSAHSFMDSPSAFWVLVGTYIWKNLGYDVILFLAGLAGISESLYEAAKVDGAGPVVTFFAVTLPNLLPTMFTLLVLSLINAFKVFREVYLIAGDYPHRDSIYMLQHLFNNWFRKLDMDKLAAAAVIVAVVMLALILLLRRAWDKEDA